FLASEARTAEERDRDRLRDDVYGFEENFKQRHLWKVTVATGQEQRLTEGTWSVSSYRISRDGHQILLHRTPTPLVGDGFRSEIWLMDARGGNLRALTSNAVEELDGDISPDNSQVLFL